jgi:hypothetical protein
MVLSKFISTNLDEKKKKTDLMIMRSGFHFHRHETWFQKNPGLTLIGTQGRKPFEV